MSTLIQIKNIIKPHQLSFNISGQLQIILVEMYLIFVSEVLLIGGESVKNQIKQLQEGVSDWNIYIMYCNLL